MRLVSIADYESAAEPVTIRFRPIDELPTKRTELTSRLEEPGPRLRLYDPSAPEERPRLRLVLADA